MYAHRAQYTTVSDQEANYAALQCPKDWLVSSNIVQDNIPVWLIHSVKFRSAWWHKIFNKVKVPSTSIKIGTLYDSNQIKAIFLHKNCNSTCTPAKFFFFFWA